MRKRAIPNFFTRYRGAGILFGVRTASETFVLLGQRRSSGVWSIPGGGADLGDAGLRQTAYRETIEEFGMVPSPHQHLFTLTYPFGIVGFHWQTWVIELPTQPNPSEFPNRMAKDFHEFRDAAWFSVNNLPAKTHWLLYPAIWRLQIALRFRLFKPMK